MNFREIEEKRRGEGESRIGGWKSESNDLKSRKWVFIPRSQRRGAARSLLRIIVTMPQRYPLIFSTVCGAATLRGATL